MLEEKKLFCRIVNKFEDFNIPKHRIIKLVRIMEPISFVNTYV